MLHRHSSAHTIWSASTKVFGLVIEIVYASLKVVDDAINLIGGWNEEGLESRLCLVEHPAP